MPSFISHLIDMILTALGMASPDVKKRKELRKLQGELKTEAGTIYRVQGNQLLPAFASAVNEFRRLLLPLYEIIKTTVDEYSNPDSDRCWDYLIIMHFDQDLLSMKESFSYESISARCGERGNKEGDLQEMSREFERFTDNLKSSAFETVDSDLKNLHRLATLCRHNFEHLLRHFDEHVATEDPAWRPVFSAVHAELAVQELHDLYFITQNFSPDSRLILNLSALASYAGGAGGGGISDELERKLSMVLDRIRKLLQFQLNPDILVRILKVAQNNPDFVPRAETEHHSYTAAYRKRVEEQFTKTVERIRREWKDTAIFQGIRTMFGSAELLTVKGYSEEKSHELEESGLGFFTYIIPVRILKSFLIGKYEKNIRESVGRLLVEGFYHMRSIQESFAHTVEECEKALSSYSAFEEGINSDGSYSIRTLNTLKTDSRLKGQEALTQKVIEGLNENARILIETQVRTFTNLALNLEDFLQDARSKNPERILNIRTIGGTSNMHFITALKQGYGDILHFLRLMQYFTHVDERAFTGLAETLPAS